MKISIIYPICGLPPAQEDGQPHPYLLTSLDSVLQAAGGIDFELLIGIDGQRPWVRAYVGHWAQLRGITNERLKVYELPFTGSWGNRQRNFLLLQAQGDYISFLDHDDAYRPGAFAAIAQMAESHPRQPLLFKMNVFQFGSQSRPTREPATLWREETLGQIAIGRVGGHMFVVPNEQHLLSVWPTNLYEADFHFIKNTLDNFAQLNLPPVWVDFVLSDVRPWASAFSP